MPFTLAHPAAVIPLRRVLGRYAVLSALVTGSVTPDLWFLLPLPVSRNDSHGIAGLFWFCVPVGVAAYVVFHRFLKHPVVSLLPPVMAARLVPLLEREPGLPRTSWKAVVLSVLVGAATHSVWDAFTHWEGRPARTVMPWLRAHLFSIGSIDVYVVNLLQHGTGALALCLLAWRTWQWLRAAPASSKAPALGLAPGERALVLSLIIAAMLVSAGVATVQEAAGPMRMSLRPGAFAALQALCWALAAYAAAWHFRRAGSSPGSR